MLLTRLTRCVRIVRSIYRAIELLEGWSGPIIENQGLFDGLDGALMVSRAVSPQVIIC